MKPMPNINLPQNYSRYTMLVAWHKFDKYERQILADLIKIESNKLPFVTLPEIWQVLCRVERSMALASYSRGTGGYWFPAANFRKRILYAVMKEHRKHHRKRLRIKI